MKPMKRKELLAQIKEATSARCGYPEEVIDEALRVMTEVYADPINLLCGKREGTGDLMELSCGLIVGEMIGYTTACATFKDTIIKMKDGIREYQTLPVRFDPTRFGP